MTLTWPLALFMLVGVPVVLGAYLWKLRRRRKQAIRYSSVALLRSVIPRNSRWKRHLPIALLLTSLVSNLLYGVSATDPVTFTVIPLILVVVAAVAIFIPARRASRVDPVIALRSS